MAILPTILGSSGFLADAKLTIRRICFFQNWPVSMLHGMFISKTNSSLNSANPFYIFTLLVHSATCLKESLMLAQREQGNLIIDSHFIECSLMTALFSSQALSSIRLSSSSSYIWTNLLYLYFIIWKQKTQTIGFPSSLTLAYGTSSWRSLAWTGSLITSSN